MHHGKCCPLEFYFMTIDLKQELLLTLQKEMVQPKYVEI